MILFRVPRYFKYIALNKRCLYFIQSYSNYQKFEEQKNGLLYEGYRSLNAMQKFVLAAGSALAASYDPLQGDMVAALGETTGHVALEKLRLLMLNSEIGCRILKEKPVINSKTLPVEKLITYPKYTFGYNYADFMVKNNITSDSRNKVHYVDDSELAYIMYRYRQIHDFVHLLLGFSVAVPAEVIVKWFEMAHFGFPMNALAAFFGPLSTKFENHSYIRKFIPWAVYNGFTCKLLLNIYFEEKLEEDFEELKKDIGITAAPHPKI